jgi:hypothetical protein
MSRDAKFHSRKAAHSIAGGRMPNAEAMTKSECRIGAISGWLHSVDSVRFSAFSAVQKAKAAQQRRTPKRFAQSVTSV